MDAHAEAQLIARCRRGEPDAWDELFDQHYAAAGRFVFQLGHDLSREDVEEICQESFLAVIRNLDAFRGGCRFQTWIFRIAANKARDHRERQRAAKRGGNQPTISLQDQDPERGAPLDPPAPDPAPDTAVLNGERIALVHAALDELGQPCRELIELRYFAELGYDEIGAALKLNAKTVSSRLSRCLDRLEQIVKAAFSRENSTVSPSNR